MPDLAGSTAYRALVVRALVFGVAVGVAPPAFAQAPAPVATPAAAPAAPAPAAAVEKPVEVPKGTVGGQAAASSGATNVDEGKFASAVAPADDVTHATELELSAGGLFLSGNARSMALTGGGKFRLRRKRHEVSAMMVGNYGRASVAEATGERVSRANASNIQGRVRYDFFFHPRVSFFTMGTARHDPFLGLAARVRIDPGFAFYAIQQAKHRLWGELGYDFQYDVRRVYDVKQPCLRNGEVEECYALAIENVPFSRSSLVADRTLAVHSLRLFGGYVNQLSELVTLSTGLEYIQGLAPLRSSDTDPPIPSGEVVPRTRLWVNWDAALSVSVRKNLAFATTFTLRYDNAPLPSVRRLDTITALNLTYKFF